MKTGLGLGVDRDHYVGGVVITPETIDFMDVIGVPDDGTIYFASTPQEMTGAEMWTSVNKMSLGLKNVFGLPLEINNLSTVMDTFYPFAGGTATSCKFNFVDPQDTNGAMRITFTGGWTIDATGIQGNGTNAYANTYWDTTAKAGAQRVAYGGYKRAMGASGLFGSWDLTNPTRLYHFGNSGIFTISSTSNAGSTLLRSCAAVLNSSNTTFFTRNGIINQYAADTLTLCNIPFYLGARNNNNASINQYTNIPLSTYWQTGKVALTDAQAIAINAVVDQFNADMKRAV